MGNNPSSGLKGETTHDKRLQHFGKVRAEDRSEENSKSYSDTKSDFPDSYCGAQCGAAPCSEVNPNFPNSYNITIRYDTMMTI